MHVFISYKHEDLDFAENVMNRLKAKGFQTWADHEIRAGEEWRTVIDRSIKNAFALIVIMTPEAKASEYVTYEWAFASGLGIRVIPVMLKQTELHPRLEVLQYLDFTVPKSRPWERLLEEVQAAAKAPLAHTVRIPLNAPPFVRQAVMALDSASSTERKEAIETLLQAKAILDISGVLVDALAHPLPDVRVNAAEALGKVRDGATVPVLLDALHDPDAIVRVNAAEALGKIGDSAAVPTLCEALHDPEAIVRVSAVQALGVIKDADAVPTLLDALHDPEIDVRWHAGKALEEIKDAAAVPALLDALHDPKAYVRKSAVQALGKIKDAAVISALLNALHDPEAHVRESAAKALKHIQNAAIVPDAPHDPYDTVDEDAAEAWDRIENAVVPSHDKALDDPEAYVRESTDQALGLMRDVSADENGQRGLLGDG